MKKNILLIVLLSVFFLGSSFAQNYFLGVGDANSTGISACAACHKTGGSASPIYNQWAATKHATAHTGITSTSYGYNCLKCHNTGWDPANANYGADDYVVENPGGTPNYTITDQTNFDRVKNVQCESCHGPMGTSTRMLSGTHWGFGTTNKPDYSAENCGVCHQGTHHPYMEEWSQSGHSDAGISQPFIVTNKSCVKCHVAQNFVAYSKNPGGYTDTILVTGNDIQPLTCVTCHDPHDATNPGQLRFPTTTNSSICDKCHTVGTETVNINSTPHHTTAECLSGTPNFGYQYPGQTYTNSVHTFAVPQRCITCHVHTGGSQSKTGHKFVPQVEACASCHPDYYTAVDTSNAATRFDYRRTQTVTDSLMTVLQNKLNQANAADSLTDAFKQARYNLQSVQAEGSRGIHNTQLVQKLLRDAITNFNPTGIKNEGGIPNEYSLSQNYPNPFNPSTQISFSIPKEGNVKLTVYDVIGNEVAIIVNGYFTAGNYKVTLNASGWSSGVYYYKIESNNYKSVRKMIIIK